MKAVIDTQALTKHFGKVQAVEAVSLHIEQGEIYGFIGLNGAGKTTTIRMLLGMIRPTEGEVQLFRQRIASGNSAIWHKVGYLVETPAAYPQLTVRENLEIMRRLHHLRSKESTEFILERLGLMPYSHVKAKTLSRGNLQRLGLARALLHQPELLILDEPTVGLDPAGIVEVRELLLSLAHKQGVTVFVSSHILGEVSRFATRIGILHQGRLLQELEARQLRQLLNRRLVVATHDNPTALEILMAAGLRPQLTTDNLVVVKDEEALNHPEKIATTLVQAQLPPTLLKIEEENLESYFLRLVGVGNSC